MVAPTKVLFNPVDDAVTSVFVTAKPENDELMLTDCDCCGAAGFIRGMSTARIVSPVPGVDPRISFVLVTVRTRVPEFLVHVLTERSGFSEPMGTERVVKGNVPSVVKDPTIPATVTTGVQDAYNGTLNVIFTVIELLSQGYAELWRKDQNTGDKYSTGALMKRACPSAADARAGFADLQLLDPSAPWYDAGACPVTAVRRSVDMVTVGATIWLCALLVSTKEKVY
jgi:hypothetical protein